MSKAVAMQGRPKAPSATQNVYGNPRRGKNKEIRTGGATFSFLFQWNISVINRLNSQINVLIFMIKLTSIFNSKLFAG